MQQTHASTAYPGVINYRLPDGSEISIFLHGNKHVNWKSSLDGFTILSNNEGFLEYAVRDEHSGDLKLSGVRARNISERTSEEISFLSQQPIGLEFSSAQVDILRDFRRVREDATSAWWEDEPQFALPSAVRVPVILVGFQDRPFTRSRAEFNFLLNQLNLTTGGLSGSLRDYFLDNSFGQLDIQFDIFGPFTLDGPIIMFTDNTVLAGGTERCGGDPRNMARQAIDLANAAGADWALYSVNGTHVNTVHIIHAGHGTEAGGSRCGSIWAHAWSFSPARYHQGFLIGRYSTSAELRGNSGNDITHIGIIAHELGHSLLNILDFYDTHPGGYGGPAVGLGTWCVMASGKWNDGGRTPSNFSAWARVNAGWVSEIQLSAPANITLAPSYQAAGNVVYRINTTTPNEYFLIENRQRVGWDRFIPGSGMLIYRVDMNVPGWSNNRVNANPANRGYSVVQAGCDAIDGCSANRGTDTWPQPGRTEFTDNTTPSSRSKAGENTNKPITHIVNSATDRTVSFRFMGGITVPNITTEELPDGKVGTEYNETLLAVGEDPMTWTVINGYLPEGLHLSSTGVISGIPTTKETAEFEVSVVNNYGETTREFTIVIAADPTNIQFNDAEEVALRAWIARDNSLNIIGLTIGQTYSIYNIMGVLLHQGVVTEDVVRVGAHSFRRASQQSVYIIQSGQYAIRIVW